MKKIDRVILAVIALALAVIALNPWIAPGYVSAQSGVAEVDIRKIGGHPVRPPFQPGYEIQAIPVIILNK